ncbi:MAG: YggT family protein [Myxococcales bacterium]|nr:MAG: YggT family protein [Myxococcales bacterium]
MGFVANIIEGIASILNMFLQVYMFIIVGRVIVSWVGADPLNPIVRFLYKATEPIFSKFRRWLPFLRDLGGLDLTPLVALGVVFFLQYAVVQNLVLLSLKMKQ